MSATFRTICVFVVAFGLAAVSFAQTPPFTRTVIVNNTGSGSAAGTALLNALSSLSPGPNYNNRWVVKLEGGFYNVGSTPVIVPQYVNLVGSGRDLTIVQGSYGPPPGLLIGGLVQANSNSEIRDLTIWCVSTAGVQETCQALSANGTLPRLSNLAIAVGGTGTGSHWGIRALNAVPRIDEVNVTVDVDNAYDAYGIAYDGSSAMNIRRSYIQARDANHNNWAVVIKDNFGSSFAEDSTFEAISGDNAAGITFLDSTASQSVQFDNCKIQGYSATTVNRGIHEENTLAGNPQIWVRGGRVYSTGDAIVQPSATVWIVNAEVDAGTTGAPNACNTFNSDLICALHVRMASSFVQNGIVTGLSSEKCAGIVTKGFALLFTACP